MKTPNIYIFFLNFSKSHASSWYTSKWNGTHHFREEKKSLRVCVNASLGAITINKIHRAKEPISAYHIMYATRAPFKVIPLCLTIYIYIYVLSFWTRFKSQAHLISFNSIGCVICSAHKHTQTHINIILIWIRGKKPFKFNSAAHRHIEETSRTQTALELESVGVSRNTSNIIGPSDCCWLKLSLCAARIQARTIALSVYVCESEKTRVPMIHGRSLACERDACTERHHGCQQRQYGSEWHEQPATVAMALIVYTHARAANVYLWVCVPA